MKIYDQTRNHITKLRDYWKDLNSQNWISGLTYGAVSRNTRSDCKNMMLYNSRVGEDVWEIYGEHGIQTSKAWRKSFLSIFRRTDGAHEEPIYFSPETKSKTAGRKLILGKIGCRRGREQQRTRWLQSITDSKVLGLNKNLGYLKGRWAQGSCYTWSQKSLTSLSDWTI